MRWIGHVMAPCGGNRAGGGMAAGLRRGLGALLPGLSLVWIAAAALVWIAPAAQAGGPLAQPQEAVILTLSGAIARGNDTGEARFDRPMLEALPQHEFATSTVWTEGVSTYSGVLLRDLLAAVGAEGEALVAHGIDGYSATIPLDTVTDDGPLVALLVDGAPMSVRERGPLWIVFPYDDNPMYRNDTTYGRSVWQLTRIEIER